MQGFYKKAELELADPAAQHAASRWPQAEINPAIVERYYQTRAIRRIAEAFERDHDRKALVVMATGAGKTRTVIALCDLLMRCNWAKRVLFLADRVALVNQAVNAFKRHLPDASPVNLVTEKDAEGRVFVSTYPTMMGLIDETRDGQRRFGVGHFDLVIIDEAHRSVFQKYRAIFDYFDSLLVGLTATPKDEVDRNTYSLFDLENGVPTDAYSLEEAVQEGSSCRRRRSRCRSSSSARGSSTTSCRKRTRTSGTRWSGTRTASVPDRVEAEAVNKWLFNKDTVDKVLAHLMTRGLTVAGGDRLGKTIIFAKNQAHAEFIAERFNANYPHYKGEFARVITFKTEYAQSLIDNFSNKDKAPHIAISVDMLDTGIDVPEVVNLVFFKLVRSKTKFWQMLGRGTRLCPDLFGPGKHKEFFYLFDYCQNLEYFSQNPETTEGALGESLGKRLFKARLELIAELDKKLGGSSRRLSRSPTATYGEPDDRSRGARRDCRAAASEVAAMNLDNFVVRPQRRIVEKYAKAEAWAVLSGEALAELSHEVAGLPSELDPENEEAKRFDLLVLQPAAGAAALRAWLRAAARSGQGDRRAAGGEVGHPDGAGADGADPGRADRRMVAGRDRPDAGSGAPAAADLVQLIEKQKRKPIYTDFEDEMGGETGVELPGFAGRRTSRSSAPRRRHFCARIRTTSPSTSCG